ncbi:MAG: protein-disulfide reductase DsbD domain-containing protein, partial [Verrucomicrobiota bacterium]
MTRLTSILLATIILTDCARAQFDAADGAAASPATPATPATTASLVSEAQAMAPGKSFTLALELKHPAGWHSYYLNSGGIENSPTLEWQLPAGFSAGPIQWPTPSLKDGYSGKSFIYPGSPVLLVDITAPASLKAGTRVTLTAKASWQICSELCLNETQDFTLSLPVTATGAADPALAGFFAQARGRIPMASAAWSVTAQAADSRFILRLSPRA